MPVQLRHRSNKPIELIELIELIEPIEPIEPEAANIGENNLTITQN